MVEDVKLSQAAAEAKGADPDDSCHGRAVRLVYVTMPDGVTLPRWRYEG